MRKEESIISIKRDFIACEIKDEIGTIVIDNPPMNTLSTAMKNDMKRLFEELEERKEEIRVLIITGTDKVFVAGGDVTAFVKLNPESGRSRIKGTREMFRKIEKFEVPIICAINGYCFGGGLELAMICDIRIASERAQLGLLEINVGTLPGAGGTQRLPRLVGAGIAKEMIFTGKKIAASEAKAIGLVNNVVPHEKLMGEAMEMARLICTKPRINLRAAKEAIDRGLNMTLEEGLRVEADLWCHLTGTEDQKEGARAFLEKRKPVYRGK